jgi:UDP-N-acetylmuramoylalanine--D-glutamate ligase
MRPLGSEVDSRFSGKRVHVIGLGSWGTGRAVARALWARGAEVTVSDVKPAEALASEIEKLKDTGVVIQTGEEAYQGIEEADLVVPSPGVALDIPPLLRARERGARVVSEIEVAFWLAPCPIVAVTGTKGKTTTTTLIGELLAGEGKSALVGGNIGRPLIELVEAAHPGDLLVAEVSSFQLEAIEQFRARVAVLLNVLPDHLDRHASIEAYREAKARLLANQRPEDTAVVNRDNEDAWALRERGQAQVVPYSVERPEPAGADIAEGWLRVAGRRVCPVSAVRLRGRHNLGNALAALAAARAAGASLENAAATLERFAGLEHRLETAGQIGDVVFINDSQATTPEATVAALDAFEGPVALIAGGRAKVHDFSGLAEAIARRGARLIVMGEAGAEITEAARRAEVGQITHAKDLAEAVDLAYEQARPSGVVLLSPACASFDMFENMAERGRLFKERVREIAAREGTR